MLNFMDSRCCGDFSQEGAEHMYLWPDIFWQFENLCGRYQEVMTKRKRLWKLSEPKLRIHKYVVPVQPSNERPYVQLVHLNKPIYSRTEQLSYPQIRQLVCLKNTKSYTNFAPERKQSVNRTMRRSLYSMYTHLAGRAPMQMPTKKVSWQPSDWKKHMNRIAKLARPKPTPKPPPEPKTKPDPPDIPVDISKQLIDPKKGKTLYRPEEFFARIARRRLLKLSRPKQDNSDPVVEWHFTKAMQNFRASERLINLAKSRVPYAPDDYNPWRISKAALSYRPTYRIKELSLPLHRMSRHDIRKSDFHISDAVLRARPTARIKLLAEPRDYLDTNTRTNPYSVSRAALRAIASPRILQLAKPRRFLK